MSGPEIAAISVGGTILYALMAIATARVCYVIAHKKDSYALPQGGYGMAGLFWPVTVPVGGAALILLAIVFGIEWMITRDR